MSDPEFEDWLKAVVRFLRKKRAQKFFGEITFKVQEGNSKNVSLNQSYNTTGFMAASIEN